MDQDEATLLSLKDAATFLGVSVPTVRRWAQQKKLLGLKVGSRGDWRFTKFDLLGVIKGRAEEGTGDTSNKFSKIRSLLIRDANAIQKLATKHHKHFLGGKFFKNEIMEKYRHNHIMIVRELANNIGVDTLERGAAIFKKLGKKLATESLSDGLTIEEAVDGTIFLKQAIWQKLKREGFLKTLTVDDFYEFSFSIGTNCDVLVSEMAFVYHENYSKTLHEQSRQKDEFMGVATHELKTPVTSLKAFAQVLQQRFAKAGDEKSALHLAKMDTQLNKLTALIGDLLDATKIDAGKLQFHEEYFDFNELVEEIVEEMQRTTQRHTIKAKVTPSKTMYGDRTRIGQVMTNLISNAIKYSPHAKDILVNTAVDGKQIAFCVQDFGIGIKKEFHTKIFERFQRVSEQDTYGGLGLGLFIASKIISRHGGQITVESEEGKGATFCIRLPLDKTRIPQKSNPITRGEIDHA